MNNLLPTDVHFIVSRLPKDIREVLQTKPLFLGGGFIRATIAGEHASDIDLFGETVDKLKLIALELANKRKGRVHETKNAITLLAPPRLPVQFITRWLYNDASKLVESFDFTIAQAAIWFSEEKWCSMCSERFYPDLAARRLVYTFPQRNEDAGGSMLRVRKFLARGYNIQASSLGKVISRLIYGLDEDYLRGTARDEVHTGKVITGLLREVDPLAVIDGIEALDEHEIIKQEETT